eukprot:gene2535-2904_t
MDFVRKMVSKKKRRFEWNNFDLDLTYITDKIIAMGFPSESIEGLYRNNMKDVQRFFNTLHPDKYKVFNLCSERKYPHDKFGNRVSEYPFDDHNPPELEVIAAFCEDVEAWLEEHPENVAAVHCKAGKGRTGTMIACYLLYSRACQTGSESIRMFGNKRTHNGKGITIPSQLRYVRYFEALVQYGRPIQRAPSTITKVLSAIRMNPLPNFNLGGGCEPFLSLELKGKNAFYTKPMKVKKGTQSVEIDCGNILLSGDVKLQVYNKNSKGLMFSFCFHTAFVEGNKMQIRRLEIDRAHKDTSHKHFHQNFTIELVFCEELLEVDQTEESALASGASSQPFGQSTFQTGLAKLYSGGTKSNIFSQEDVASQLAQMAVLEAADSATNNGGAQVAEGRPRAHALIFTCPKCYDSIKPDEPSVNNGKNNVHWRCMTCDKCHKSLVNQTNCLFQEDGTSLCTDCGTTSGFFKMCAGCDQVIKTSDFEEVGQLTFHRQCFLCQLCFSYLGGQEFTIKNKLLECAKCIARGKELYKIQVVSPDKAPVDEYKSKRQSTLVKCQKCRLNVGLRPLILDIGIWHKECFSCFECNQTITTSIYYIKDEHPICSDCDRKQHKQIIEEFNCFACKQRITDHEMMEAIGEKWHVECLTCSVCNRQIDGPFGDEDGLIYCKEHYEEKFGTRCDHCQKMVVGTFLKVNGKQLHPECFTCYLCDDVLEGGRYFGKGDNVICEKCRQTDLVKRRTQIQLQNKMIGTRPSATTIPTITTSSTTSTATTTPTTPTITPFIPSSPTQLKQLRSGSVESNDGNNLLFVKRSHTTRQSVRVNLSDLSAANQSVDKLYPSLHRQLLRQQQQQQQFKSARPIKELPRVSAHTGQNIDTTAHSNLSFFYFMKFFKNRLAVASAGTHSRLTLASKSSLAMTS